MGSSCPVMLMRCSNVWRYIRLNVESLVITPCCCFSVQPVGVGLSSKYIIKPRLHRIEIVSQNAAGIGITGHTAVIVFAVVNRSSFHHGQQPPPVRAKPLTSNGSFKLACRAALRASLFCRRQVRRASFFFLPFNLSRYFSTGTLAAVGGFLSFGFFCCRVRCLALCGAAGVFTAFRNRDLAYNREKSNSPLKLFC